MQLLLWRYYFVLLLMAVLQANLYFLNILNFTSATNATKGTGTLPSNPVGFINITVAGKPYKVPYYNV